jgi:hypothetical protein
MLGRLEFFRSKPRVRPLPEQRWPEGSASLPGPALAVSGIASCRGLLIFRRSRGRSPGAASRSMVPAYAGFGSSMPRTDAVLVARAAYSRVRSILQAKGRSSRTCVASTSPYCCATPWHETFAQKNENNGPKEIKGYRSVIREGDDLKIRMLIWNITPAPAATPSPTTTRTTNSILIRRVTERLSEGVIQPPRGHPFPRLNVLYFSFRAVAL